MENPLAHYSIGLKLRALRNERRLTLTRLGSATGLSTALLSKLETDHMVPTLLTLVKICGVYGVGLDYFFTAAEHHSIAITRHAHIREQGRAQKSVKTLPLHVPSVDDRLVANVLELPPGVASTMSDFRTGMQLLAFVIEGTLQLDCLGTREILKTGDCIVLNTSASVMWSASEDQPCQVLVVKGTS